MSVRCRSADSSLGTAVKWFPSRYLEEKCRVTPAKRHHTLSSPQRHVPGFPDWVGSLVYSLIGPRPPSRHTARLSFNMYLCAYSADDVSLHCSAGLHDGRALVGHCPEVNLPKTVQSEVQQVPNEQNTHCGPSPTRRVSRLRKQQLRGVKTLAQSHKWLTAL